jgi:hypothetical protein
MAYRSAKPVVCRIIYIFITFKQHVLTLKQATATGEVSLVTTTYLQIITAAISMWHVYERRRYELYCSQRVVPLKRSQKGKKTSKNNRKKERFWEKQKQRKKKKVTKEKTNLCLKKDSRNQDNLIKLFVSTRIYVRINRSAKFDMADHSGRAI